RANNNAGWKAFLAKVHTFLQQLNQAGATMVTVSEVLGNQSLARRAEFGGKTFSLDARPDTPDFRDALFQPTLVNVPPARTLEDYRGAGVPILDQGQEGACTGFGLATVVNYLLRTR